MSNSYFQFKEFRIDQDRCAMKVCTDSCIFGAWIPVSDDLQEVLDIGTGTGLLALIMAQRTNANIDAIEIEADAFRQAQENMQRSKWNDRLHIFHKDIAEYSTDKKYDLIICNPPFYEGNIESENNKEKIAKHAHGLTLNKLIKSIASLTSPDTKLALLLPYYRKQETVQLLKIQGWFIEQELSVKNRENDPYFRYLVYCSQKEEITISEELQIYKNEKEYTEKFTELLSHLYLKI